jgi:hypothetical protein
LLLHAEILDYVRNLPPGTPERLVTERNLRRLVRLQHTTRVSEAEKRIRGYAANQAKRRFQSRSIG